jgi:hypothetical protein
MTTTNQNDSYFQSYHRLVLAGLLRQPNHRLKITTVNPWKRRNPLVFRRRCHRHPLEIIQYELYRLNQAKNLRPATMKTATAELSATTTATEYQRGDRKGMTKGQGILQ